MCSWLPCTEPGVERAIAARVEALEAQRDALAAALVAVRELYLSSVDYRTSQPVDPIPGMLHTIGHALQTYRESR